jgi:uronate dehydrogenase
VTVLITGAAGGVGGFLRRGLPALGWDLRCFDLVPPRDAAHGTREEWLFGDVADPEVLDRATRGVAAVVHLAGIPTEVPEFARLLHSNVDGAYQVFEAARRNGVPRVLYASSNHAVGCHESGAALREDAVVRPDSLYGATKAFGEALGSYYADRHGMAVACLRIGSCFELPTQVRHLATWLSPGDAVRLTDALLHAPDLRYATVNAISANTRAWWSLDTARALGYRPQDDAELYAEELLAIFGELGPDDPDARYVGGRMAARP